MTDIVSLLLTYQQEVTAIAKRHKASWERFGFPDVFANDYWRLQPESADNVELLEEKIGVILPTDFRNFMLEVGGFPLPGFGRVLSANQVCLGSMKSIDFPGRKSRSSETFVLSQPLTQEGQFGLRLGLHEYLNTLVFTDDDNYGSAAGLISFGSEAKGVRSEYIFDEAWTGSYRFGSLKALIGCLTEEALRSLRTFDDPPQ